eukprot:2972760-Amphidinium_carterae.2
MQIPGLGLRYQLQALSLFLCLPALVNTYTSQGWLSSHLVQVTKHPQECAGSRCMHTSLSCKSWFVVMLAFACFGVCRALWANLHTGFHARFRPQLDTSALELSSMTVSLLFAYYTKLVCASAVLKNLVAISLYKVVGGHGRNSAYKFQHFCTHLRKQYF